MRFSREHDSPAPGSVVAPVLEGSRPLLVEVQALVAPTGAPSPRRTASGVDPNRLALLVAVLGRRAGVGLSGHDVYANLAGGLTVTEPGLDLPLALALASSLRDLPLATGTVAIGEVGLLGELRSVGGLDRRLREAARLGFTRAIVPRTHGRDQPVVPGVETVAAGSAGGGDPGRDQLAVGFVATRRVSRRAGAVRPWAASRRAGAVTAAPERAAVAAC